MRPNTASPVEVFADVLCPFAYAGIELLRSRRDPALASRYPLWVRAWPLEVINSAPFDPSLIAEEIVALRGTVVPDLFAGFDAGAFPSSSLPAFALAAAAYRDGYITGEAVSVELRHRLWERGQDISDPTILNEVAAAYSLEVTDADRASVTNDHSEGAERGVVGSPYFFAGGEGFFCPAMSVSHDERGFHVAATAERFEPFVAAAFS